MTENINEKFAKEVVPSYGIRLSIKNDSGLEVARAFFYVLHNDLHSQPFALLEDVMVEKDERGLGYGTELIKQAVTEAKKINCYKLIATSRYARKAVHNFYLNLGFEDWGKEFRINL